MSAAMAVDPDQVTLRIGGKIFGGWQQVRVTRGIEVMPSSFEVTLTERYPGQAENVVITPGQALLLKIGADTVITGYVDRYQPTISADDHAVTISGRGRCQDLVDCSAGILPGENNFRMQVNVVTALKLAQDLAAPFDISVAQITEDAGRPIQTFLINFGETPFEVIDRVCRYEALLAYEGTDGNLILSGVSTDKMASGFSVPGNVESASVSYAMDQRFSDIYGVWTSTDTLTQVRSDANGSVGVMHGHAQDGGVSRFRPKAIVSEQTQGGIDLGQRRAEWEIKRRFGRSQAVNLTCDSWRDSAGTLWTPNTLALVDIPDLKISQQSWLIAEVVFRRGDDGTHADLTLMPPQAFDPEPSLLQGFDWQVGQDLPGAASNPSGPQITST